MHCILTKPVFSDHLCYVTIFQCSLGKSHKTGLNVFLILYVFCVVSHYLSLFVLSFVLWCPLRFSVHINLQLFDACLIYVISFCLRNVVSNTYCVVFLLCLSSSCVPYVPVSLDCPFLIVPSVFSNVDLWFVEWSGKNDLPFD